MRDTDFSTLKRKSRKLDRILEAYQSSPSRTTASRRRVAWDEPGERDSDEIRQHNAYLAKKLQNKKDAKQRLKSKGIVPTRDGKPIFEKLKGLDSTQELSEQSLRSLRHLYDVSKVHCFEQWILEIAMAGKKQS